MTGLRHEIGQDYPRPPLLQQVPQTLRLSIGDTVVGQTDQAWRVCETHHAPSDYLPPEAFAPDLLHPVSVVSSCEWKGRAGSFDLLWAGRRRLRAGWSYAQPTPEFAPIADFVAVYAWAVDAVVVGGEVVQPHPGDFYGGWVTSNLRGTIRGGPGTQGWYSRAKFPAAPLSQTAQDPHCAARIAAYMILRGIHRPRRWKCMFFLAACWRL